MGIRFDKPNQSGYWWAHERSDPEDADILLVFVEIDYTVWYGKVVFHLNDFDWWEKFEENYGSQTKTPNVYV